MINFDEFSSELFQTLRAYGREMVLYDRDGTRVYEPEPARRFYLVGDNILISVQEDGDNSSLKLYLSPSHNITQVSGFIDVLRVMATKANLLFHVKKFNKEITPKDFSTRASVQEQQEFEKMNIMEGMYGTSKSSYLKLENARMIVRHGSKIRENMIGSRGRNIQSIFIENAQGERFLFPVNVLAGGRAMAQHVNQGGTFADEVGAQIIRMAQDFKNLALVVQPTTASKVTDPQAYAGLRESVITAMHKQKLAFARIYEARSYAKEINKMVESLALMETSIDLSESITKFTSILGESFDDVILNTLARLVTVESVITENPMPVETTEVVQLDTPQNTLDDTEDLELAFQCGASDFENGLEITCNPFPLNSTEYQAWLNGWKNSNENNNVKNHTAVDKFNSWMDEFNPNRMFKPQVAEDASTEQDSEVDEMANINDLSSGMYKHKNAAAATRDVRLGNDTVTLSNGDTYRSLGPVKSPDLVKGVVFMGSYNSYNQGANVYELLGYATSRDGTVKFDSLKAAARAYGVKTLNALDAAVKEENGGKYNAGIRMVVKDLDDGSSGDWFYVDSGKFCRGSGAERLSFTKLEKVVGEPVTDENEGQLKIEEQTLDEGTWIVKSLDGVEKRFKDGNSQAAKDWAGSNQRKPKEPKVDRSAQKQAAINVAFMAIMHVDVWGEMDVVDIINSKIVPRMIAAYNKAPDDTFSDDFYNALKSAINHNFDGLMKYLNLGAKVNGYRDFADYEAEMSNLTGGNLDENTNASHYDREADNSDQEIGEDTEPTVKCYKLAITGLPPTEKKLWAFAENQEVLTIEHIKVAAGGKFIEVYPHWRTPANDQEQAQLQRAWNSFDASYDETNYDEDGEPISENDGTEVDEDFIDPTSLNVDSYKIFDDGVCTDEQINEFIEQQQIVDISGFERKDGFVYFKVPRVRMYDKGIANDLAYEFNEFQFNCTPEGQMGESQVKQNQSKSLGDEIVAKDENGKPHDRAYLDRMRALAGLK